MRWLAVLLFVPWIGSAQVIPSSSSYNADIVWEGVYTDGPAGKVNRGVADSEGHIGLVFMPEDMTLVATMVRRMLATSMALSGYATA